MKRKMENGVKPLRKASDLTQCCLIQVKLGLQLCRDLLFKDLRKARLSFPTHQYCSIGSLQLSIHP